MPQTSLKAECCQVAFNLHLSNPVMGGGESEDSRVKTENMSLFPAHDNQGPGRKAVFLPSLSEKLSLSSVLPGGPIALGSTTALLRI